VGEVAGGIGAGIETIASLLPGGGFATAVHEASQGNFGAAALAVITGGAALKVLHAGPKAAKGAAAGGKTVLGHFPEYRRLGDSLNARTFYIPEAAWNKMSEAERWAANQKFLDRMISRGDEIILATPLDEVRPGSYLARELEYLVSKGYVPSADGTRLIKP